MSNLYYNFLSKRLTKWIDSRKNLKPGDKYFILLDNLKETANFYASLENLDYNGKFNFHSEEFNYKAIGMDNNGVKVLFVAPINNITQDFLVTIRNRVNANQGEWKNTAVFFIVYDALDSIIGGSFDVSQKGGPFYIKEIKNEIKEEIKKQNKLLSGEQKALEIYLDTLTENSYAVLKDYETVFSILEKGKMNNQDFNRMGYFPDETLETIPKDVMEKRLAANQSMFEKVEVFHDFIDIEDKLKEEVSGDTLINKLSKIEDWKNTQYRDIEKGIQEKNKDKNINLNYDLDKTLDNQSKSWFRLEAKKGVKSKKAHMLMSSLNCFNDEFCFEIFFDDNVNKSNIIQSNTFIFEGHNQKKEDFEIITKGKKLIVKIKQFNPLSTYGGLLRYKHKGVNKLTFDIKFMIIPISLDEIQNVRPNFKIEIKKSAKQFYYGIPSELKNFQFGTCVDKTIYVARLEELNGIDIINSEIILEDSVLEDEVNGALHINPKLSGAFFPISFLDIIEKATPVKPLGIERQRLMEKESQFIYEDDKVINGSNIMLVEKTYKVQLNIEKQMIIQKSFFGRKIGDKYISENITLPDSVEKAYNKLFAFYESEKTLPSLAVSTSQYLKILEEILETIQWCMKEVVEGEKVADNYSNMVLIGMIQENDSFIATPLNPLLIAYQIELSRQLKYMVDVPRENILSTLHPQYLMPYIKLKDEEYQSSYTKNVPRWLFYNKLQERQLSDLASNIIIHRLDDYVTQYKFLFETNKEMSLNIAAIKLVDEKTFFDAIINYMLKKIKAVDSLDEINPINIYFDKLSFQIGSLFHELYEVRSMDRLNDLLKTPYKGSSFEDYEVLDLLKKKINVYRLPKNQNIADLGLFFHVTFYQFIQKKGISIAKMEKLEKNYAMGGLLSSPQYHKEGNSYANGFGVGNLWEDNTTKLIEFSYQWNSFVACANKDTDIYRKGDTLINNIPQLSQGEIKPILDNSSWVTLLNLDVDLSYFFDEKNGEMLVIHYTDQSIMSQYESVTVTNDIKQYERLLRENVLKDLSENENFDTKEVIKNFNVINGQWLLKLISSKSKQQYNDNILREKLSIISAYKEMLGILEHPSFYWVPISLEEILRVSGMVGLSMKDGLFSSKNLGQKGVTSDDLLFVGIDLRSDKIKLHYLPIEVKVGQNTKTVTEKAIEQVKHTSDILIQFLSEQNNDIFMRNYYRNFFMSIIIGNLEKMMNSGIFPGETIPDYKQIKNRLTVGDYDISYELEKHYGKGIVFEFSKNETSRSTSLISNDEILLIEVPEKDAYNIVADKTISVIQNIQNEKFDFTHDVLLKHKLKIKDFLYEEEKEDVVEKENNNDNIDAELIVSLNKSLADTSDNRKESLNTMTENLEFKINENSDEVFEKEADLDVTLEDKRILLGKIDKSKHDLYWEFGNKKLANRHLFITGKSGQGKTYFIQTLLSELSNQNINSLVIDYTDGFLQNQLDTEFISKYEGKIKNRYILKEKLPINPFKIQEIDLGGITIPETDQDMVDRVVQILDFVFDLGIQQKTLLSDAILEGYRKNGGSYRFSHLANELKYSEDKSCQTVYGRISSLLNRDPFSYEDNFDWSQIFSNTGEINIFQLKGYQLNIQKVLIEFLLWDLFQYSTRVGTEEMPIPIVLDEVQNLSFSQSSPAVKILREGRKFGISGIFATQSLDSIKGNDAESIYNAAEQLHFLPPESQVSMIAKSITSNPLDKKEIETSLKTLLKGEAVVYGPVRTDDGELSEPKLNVVKIASFENRNTSI